MAKSNRVNSLIGSARFALQRATLTLLMADSSNYEPSTEGRLKETMSALLEAQKRIDTAIVQNNEDYRRRTGSISHG